MSFGDKSTALYAKRLILFPNVNGEREFRGIRFFIHTNL